MKPIGISYPDGTISDGEEVSRHHNWYDDDDEETAGSVTKQLAETAVGVREMSKQLGECSFKAQRPDSSTFSRPYPSSFEHSIHSYRHESTRQSSNQTHEGTSTVPNAQAP